MVQRATYTGRAFHGEHVLDDAHEAIVTLPEFEAANAVKGGPGAVHERSALLAGLIRCAGCRYAMRRTTVKARSGKRVDVYACQRRHTGGICPAPATVLASIIEPYVTERVLSFLGPVEWEAGGDGGGQLAEAQRALADAEAATGCIPLRSGAGEDRRTRGSSRGGAEAPAGGRACPRGHRRRRRGRARGATPIHARR